MDINATVSRMLTAKKWFQWAEAREHAENALEWLRRGGFPPAGLTAGETTALCLSILGEDDE